MSATKRKAKHVIESDDEFFHPDDGESSDASAAVVSKKRRVSERMVSKKMTVIELDDEMDEDEDEDEDDDVIASKATAEGKKKGGSAIVNELNVDLRGEGSLSSGPGLRPVVEIWSSSRSRSLVKKKVEPSKQREESAKVKKTPILANKTVNVESGKKAKKDEEEEEEPSKKKAVCAASTTKKKETKQLGISSFFLGADGQKSPRKVVDPKKKPPVKKVVVAPKDGEQGNLDKIYGVDNVNEPPMTKLDDMFKDLVGKIPEVLDFVDRLKGRKLRVATMCSGTESPLLALKLISRALKELHGTTFEVEHVFSCEIEPFKQAYIERNFSPPILFRDVTELGGDQAMTAYGSLVDVPLGVDLLIAGTSCVDYSGLNNQKKDINDQGESGNTFHGMLDWVIKAKPAMVILENVCSAPWDKVVEKFKDEAGYSAKQIRLDTKRYYIPHTRTRGYLFATPTTKKSAKLVDTWAETVSKKLRRHASSPLEAYLLPGDDPRIHRARMELSNKTGESEKGMRVTDWGRCESRHQRARQEEALGQKRPLTAWEDGGLCKLPDGAWTDWGFSQTERVLDLMDINTLRSAVKGFDPLYKTLVWNLSQNVDRNTEGGQAGICPCLTPSMVPYVTNRGGPLIGLEALSLQGLPLDELLLTRESEDNLADLAGNAMSTTVVGAAMLAALVVANTTLEEGDDDIVMMDSSEVQDVASHIQGEDQLPVLPLDLAKRESVSISDLLADAARSARFCACEGRSGTTTNQLQKCRDCNYTTCIRCGGRPEHSYEPITPDRLSPSEFEKKLIEVLPMRLTIHGVAESVLDKLKSAVADVGPQESDWDAWRDAFGSSLGASELRFRCLKRQTIWTASYDSPSASLELLLDPVHGAEWRLSIVPSASEPNNARVRQLLAKPVARMRVSADSSDVLKGTWEVFLPFPKECQIEITGKGELVDSWEARLGLQGDFALKKWWRSVEIGKVPADASEYLDADIAGTYTLFERCGTAMNALHIKDKDDKGKALSLFLDPTRCGKAQDDRFVFSFDNSRLDYGSERAVIASLHQSWRPNDKTDSHTVACRVSGKWVQASFISITPTDITKPATFAMPSGPLAIDLHTDACRSANALLSCRVPLLEGEKGSFWPQGDWGEVDMLHDGRSTFENLSWVLERLPVLDALKDWMDAGKPSDGDLEMDAADAIPEIFDHKTPCERCAPKEPGIRWVSKGHTVVALEDVIQAGIYEQALKKRPEPFVTQLRVEEDGIASVRIGLNVASLIHRALSRLPTENRYSEPHLSWRLTTSIEDFTPPKFRLTSNRSDPSHSQPPHFKKVPLRPEQLRSLSWMLAQEDPKADPFLEEEVSEAMLEPLGWRAEGRAERPVLVRGGVLADEVGYGKTAIILGLIDTSQSLDDDAPEPPKEEVKGVIPVKATLVVVPPHLIKQWPSEIQKFTGHALTVISITSMSNLNNLTVAEVEAADVVVISSTVWKSNIYKANLAALGAKGPIPSTEGRHFAARLKLTLAGLREQVARLKTMGKGAGVRAVVEAMEEGQNQKTTEDLAVLQSKRLVGKQYLEGKTKSTGSKKKKADKDEDEDEEEDGEGEEEEEDEDDDDDDDSGEDDDSEESDGPSKKKGKSKSKFKASSEGKASKTTGPKEKTATMSMAARVKADSWNFTDGDVKRDWKQMTCPPLEMFYFKRLVVDEFTYLKGQEHLAITGLKSAFRWVLSGTPPVRDFTAVKGIAAFLNVHLGVEDGSEMNTRKRKNQQTAVEQFHSFREVHSSAWHARRHQIAQNFLDRFVRQNIAEIDEIPTEEHIVQINLPPAERAIYLELDHHIQALELNAIKIKKGKSKGDSDREKRVTLALGESKTPEEALLKRCSHFDIDLSLAKGEDVSNAEVACEIIVTERTKQLQECKHELLEYIRESEVMHQSILETEGFEKDDDDHFKRWIKDTKRSEAVGDADAAEQLKALVEQGISTAGNEESSGVQDEDGKKKKKPAPKSKSKSDSKSKAKSTPKSNVVSAGRQDNKKKTAEDRRWELRERTHVIRRLVKELVARVRSLRYFEVVRDLQRSQLGKGTKLKVQCPAKGCERKSLPMEDVAILSSCGHMGCYNCLLEWADRQECPTPGCQAAARASSVVRADSLGIDDEQASCRFGIKLAKVVNLIQSIPKDESILVFIQFPDLMEKVGEALKAAKVGYLQVTGTASSKSTNLQKFQTGVDAKGKQIKDRVLLLNVGDESASGANLTNANHAIFVGPILTDTKEDFVAIETQAVGRVRRYGQSKKVHIYRFITLNTIDVDILEARIGEKLAARVKQCVEIDI